MMNSQKIEPNNLEIGKIQMIAAAGTSLQLVMVDLSCYVGVGVSLPLAQPRFVAGNRGTI
jgi:hypothetical protein